MSLHRLLAAVALVFAVAAAPGRARAQSATAGAIQGVVSDKSSGEVLPGVTVVVTSPQLQGSQSALTEPNGFYRITNLPPGIYMVTFYFGEATLRRTQILVNANKTTPVFAKIDSAQTGGEVIEIQGSPNIDTTSTTQGITLRQDYLKNIPIPGRTFEDALGAAAGSAGDDLGVSFSGSTSLENQYVVDGANTTGLTFGTVGTPLMNEFIEETEIITGGYQAEYGRSTGGVVNVVTQSGSNEIHGSVFTSATSDLLAKNGSRIPSQVTSIQASRRIDYDASIGFDLGGPIVRDKLWYYVGFSPNLGRATIDRYTVRRTDCRERLPDGSLSVCDPAMYQDGTPDEDDNGLLVYEDIEGGHTTLHPTTQEYQLVSKVNYSATPDHQGHISLIGNAVRNQIRGVLGQPSAVNIDQDALTTDVSAKWTSKFNDRRTEVEAQLGWHRQHFESGSADESANSLPRQTLLFGDLGTWSQLGAESAATRVACSDGVDSDPYRQIENCPDAGAGYAIGGPGALADDVEQRFSARLSGLQRVKFLGNHEIKLGGDVEQNLLSKPRAFSGDAIYDVFLSNSLNDDGGAPSGTIEARRWVSIAPRGVDDPRYDQSCGRDPLGAPGEVFACEYLGPTDVEGNTLNWSTYLQDSWQILPNLTFNAGVRYEEQYLRFAEHLQNEVDPFTLEARGKNAMEMRNMWAPRVGLTHDWTKEGRSKIYGSYGRFYESIPMDINDRSFGGETLLRQTYQASECGGPDPAIGGPPGTGCTEPPTTQAPDLFGGNGVLVAPGIKPQYLDEFIVGGEYEVIEDLKIGAAYHRRVLGRVIEDVSVDGAQTYLLANPGEFSGEEARKMLDEINDLIRTGDPDDRALARRKEAELEQYKGIRQFDKPTRDYDAFQVTALKRFSKSYFLQGSYTYSRITGNYPGLYSPDNGQVDPNISSQYDLIELLANRDGPLPQDRPHYFKLDGYYVHAVEKVGSFTGGTRIRALSGRTWEPLAAHATYGADESFLLPRGAMGRLDWDWSVDLHFGYARDLGWKGTRLEVFTDLFNVPTLIKKEGVVSVDESYTFEPVNPIVGGDYEDLIWAKSQDLTGQETADPVVRNRNFGNPTVRNTPFFATIGARLTF